MSKTNPTARTAGEAIAFAAEAIKTSDRKLRLAAEHLAFAEEMGATQRQMAKGVGKSTAWVNRLLQWRRDGYSEDTPFGAQSRERNGRHDERIREQEHAQPRSGPEQEQPEPDELKHRRERSRNKERAKKARMEAEKRARMAQLDEAVRRRLVGCLGLLASDKDGEVLAAARRCEEIRRRLNSSWDDLIVAAAEAAQARAA